MNLLNKIFLLISAYFIPCTLYAENEKGGMPQLDPSSYTSQTFWLILTFTLLFVFVNSFFFPRITEIRENRDKTINDLLKRAKENSERSSEIKNKIDQDIKEARENADEMISKSIQKNREENEKKIELLNKKLEEKSNSLIIDLDKEKKKIMNDISSYSSELSNIIYSKLLNEENNISSQEFSKLLKKEYKES